MGKQKAIEDAARAVPAYGDPLGRDTAATGRALEAADRAIDAGATQDEITAEVWRQRDQ